MEYLDQFNQLSRYASDDYKTEEKKMKKFLDGLTPALKCQLVVHAFPDFKTLMDKAIMLETGRRSLDDIRKCRHNNSAQSRNNRQKTETSKSSTPRAPTCECQEQGFHSPRRQQPFRLRRSGTLRQTVPKRQEMLRKSQTTPITTQHQDPTISTPTITTGKVT